MVLRQIDKTTCNNINNMKSLKTEQLITLCVVGLFIFENIYLYFHIDTLSSHWKSEQTIFKPDTIPSNKAPQIEMILMMKSFNLNGEYFANVPLHPANATGNVPFYGELEEHNVVLRFSEYTCSSCIQSAIERLQETFQSDSLKCNVLCITDKATDRLLSFLNEKAPAFKVFETKSTDIVRFDADNSPYIALVNAKGQILNALSFNQGNLSYIKYFCQICQEKINHAQLKK